MPLCRRGAEADLVGGVDEGFVYVQDQQVTIGGGSTIGSLGSVPIARRWESGPLPLTPEVWLDLEDGIQVRFDAATYRKHSNPARSPASDIRPKVRV